MKTTEFIVENSIIAQEADDMHRDHEVQMARSQMYSAAQAAIEIHRLLKDISEMEGLEGWVQSKLTLASQYLESVRDYMKYEAVSQQSEMTVFAEDAAGYALDKLLVEKANKKMKEQTTTTPTVGGMNKTTDAKAGTTTTNYNVGDLSVSQTKRPDQSTVQSVSYDMGPAGTVRRDKGIGFDVTTNTPYKPKDDTEQVNEMASAGASSSGGMATSMAGPAGKPGTGKPKKIANAHKPKKINVGKGVY
jgi:hypothetical protein